MRGIDIWLVRKSWCRSCTVPWSPQKTLLSFLRKERGIRYHNAVGRSYRLASPWDVGSIVRGTSFLLRYSIQHITAYARVYAM